jgi:Ni,Fe-hydrogenase III small subunit
MCPRRLAIQREQKVSRRSTDESDFKMSLFTKILRTPTVTEQLVASDAEDEVLLIARQIDARAHQLFGRSLHIREVDAGSCNGCELEISALSNPYYDMERFGLHIVASPRHADCLLVTGPVTRNMAVPLRRTYDATPDPKIVIAIGDCANTCGVFKDSSAVIGGVDKVIPVNVFVDGCPPEPVDILRGILSALDRLPRKGTQQEESK